MSLHYIVDGCNLMHHPGIRRLPQGKNNPWDCLLQAISSGRLLGSSNNSATIIFDGYPPSRVSLGVLPPSTRVIFSEDDSADDRIFRLLENVDNPANWRVVTADREIILFAKALKVQAVSPEEFFAGPATMRAGGRGAGDAQAKDLSSLQMDAINMELKEKWLKKK